MGASEPVGIIPFWQERAMQRFCAIIVWVPIMAVEPSVRAEDKPPDTRPATQPAVRGIDWPAFLVHDAAVQAELKLTNAQQAGVRGVVAELAGSLWELRNYPPDQQATRSRSLATRLRAKLKPLLSATQRERLGQITFRARGAAAALEPETASRLALTDDQRERIQAAVRKARIASETLDSLVASSQHREARDVVSRRIRTEEYNTLISILSAAQEKEWTALSGKPFDLSQIKPFLVPAPELRGKQTWVNSKPLTLAGLRGQVVVVHFWTFGCINCIHNYAAYRNWQKTFAQKGVTLVGIHTPETDGEHSVEKLREKTKENELTFPILVDNERENWKAWSNNIWPAVYLVDKQGRIRYWWYGELNWQGATGEKLMTTRIEELLREKPEHVKTVSN
jgi:peroxiredoxin